MDTNEMTEHLELLNAKLTHSLDTLVDAFDRGYEFFKEKRPDGTIDSYYAAVLSSFAEGVVRCLKHGGTAAAATSDPIIAATALVKYLSEHPEFKADLMF